MSAGEKSLGEFDLIARLTAGLPRDADDLVGLGDDCAVLRVGAQTWLVSSDASVEGVHFDFRWCSPEDVGWRAMASATSDIAAMGGVPRFATVSLAAPRTTALAVLDGLYAGLRAAATHSGLAIIGGDTTGSTGGIFVDLTVIGEAPGGRYATRAGAQPGDLLAVTGTPGRSAAALRVFMAHGNCVSLPEATRAAHLRPTPRIVAGQWLAAHDAVHAMLDVSDGVVQDAQHLAICSGVGLCIDTRVVPHDTVLETVCEAYELDARACFWAGGEDYELAVAVAPAHFEELREAFVAATGLALTVVGTFGARGGDIEVLGGLASGGFDHFR